LRIPLPSRRKERRRHYKHACSSISLGRVYKLTQSFLDEAHFISLAAPSNLNDALRKQFALDADTTDISFRSFSNGSATVLNQRPAWGAALRLRFNPSARGGAFPGVAVREILQFLLRPPPYRSRLQASIFELDA
jgi:hypothetical protein